MSYRIFTKKNEQNLPKTEDQNILPINGIPSRDENVQMLETTPESEKQIHG